MICWKVGESSNVKSCEKILVHVVDIRMIACFTIGMPDMIYAFIILLHININLWKWARDWF